MYKKLIPLLALILLITGLVFIFWALPIIQRDHTRKLDQLTLAAELGVNINDYPGRYSFPSGYFYTVLKPGMTLDQVHLIIRGYMKVFNCFGHNEIYYYCSDEDSSAERFRVRYDHQLIFEDMIGEDVHERTIDVGGCQPGLLTQN